MTLTQRLVIGGFRGLTSLICRIDDAELKKVPLQGPLLIYTNHVNLFEIPTLYTRLQPRRFHGMVHAGRFENPILRWLLHVAEAIPLHRGEPDITALRKGLNVLGRGEMLVIAPEGTRSHHGKLQNAHPGVVLLALKARAPLLPVAFYGAEKYVESLRRLRRSDFHIRVGEPFRLDERGEKVTRAVREKMLDEMMYRLASLLPAQYRGRYVEPATCGEQYLVPRGAGGGKDTYRTMSQ